MLQRSGFATSFVLLLLLLSSVEVLPLSGNTLDRPLAAINDNRRSAGTLSDGRLTLNLCAAAGHWQPEGDQGPSLQIEAFAEDSGPLQVPGPLMHVPEGTEILARVRNELDQRLRVHGLCPRDGSPCAPIEIQPGEATEVRFKSDSVDRGFGGSGGSGSRLAHRGSLANSDYGLRATSPELRTSACVEPIGSSNTPIM